MEESKTTRLSPIGIGSVFHSYLPHIVVELYIVSHLFSSTLYFKDYDDRKSIHNKIKGLTDKGLGYRKIHSILIKEGFDIGKSPSCVYSMIKKLEKRYPGGSFSVEKSEVRAKGDR